MAGERRAADQVNGLQIRGATGDLTQIDLPPGIRSGLRDAVETLEGVTGIGFTRFGTRDVVRHPLVGRIVDAYDQRAAAAREHSRGKAGRGIEGA